MIFGEIDSLFSILERIKKPFNKINKTRTNDEELVSTRLISAFQAHGVHRNQTPRIIQHGLTLNDVKTDECLLKKLDEDIINHACTMLGINRDWLDGASTEIYETYNFYKHPKLFEEFLLQILERTGSEKLSGVLLTTGRKDRDGNTVLLLQEIVGLINDKPYYRYYLCTDWCFSYWKSRAYLTACVAICLKHSVFIHGKYAEESFINSISKGSNLLNFGNNGIYSIKGNTWDAEDLALNPQVYLKDVDPESDKFGITSALSLWLQLEGQGVLNCGFEDMQVRRSFEEALEKLS